MRSCFNDGSSTCAGCTPGPLRGLTFAPVLPSMRSLFTSPTDRATGGAKPSQSFAFGPGSGGERSPVSRRARGIGQDREHVGEVAPAARCRIGPPVSTEYVRRDPVGWPAARLVWFARERQARRHHIVSVSAHRGHGSTRRSSTLAGHHEPSQSGPLIGPEPSQWLNRAGCRHRAGTCERSSSPAHTFPRERICPHAGFRGGSFPIRAASTAAHRTPRTPWRSGGRLIPGNQAISVTRSMHVTSLDEQNDTLP
jgi:hypothetical protein